MEYRKDLSPPRDWQAFEDLCLSLWRLKLLNIKKNGRAGQAQDGVDIFGKDPNTGGWVGIQCKQKSQWPRQRLTELQVKDSVLCAESFSPSLMHFIVATTDRRDESVQRFVREFSDRRRRAGAFTVDLFAWDDIQELLEEREDSSLERGVSALKQRNWEPALKLLEEAMLETAAPPEVGCYLALAIIEERSFNALKRTERRRIESLLKSAVGQSKRCLLGVYLLERLEEEYYSYHCIPSSLPALIEEATAQGEGLALSDQDLELIGTLPEWKSHQ